MSEHQEANKKRLGELVTEAYKAAGHTRRSLAKAVGISDRTLYAVEVGASIPKEKLQRSLEEALQWSKGSIADVLGLGREADLESVDLEWMSGGGKWVGGMEAPLTARGERGTKSGEPDSAVIQRLTFAAADVAILLREKDRRIHELEQQVALLQGGYDLAADGSPNRGRALRDHFDSVEQENQDTA